VVALTTCACLALGCTSPKGSAAQEGVPKPSVAAATARPDPALALANAQERLLAEAIARARKALERPPTDKDAAETPIDERLTRLLLAGPEIRTWAAFGLGRHCAEHSAAALPLLVSAAAVWLAAEAPPNERELHVVANAIGACQTRGAEATLAGWLAPAPAADADALIQSAAMGLGALADATGTLRESSLAALLDATAARKDPILLYPLSRLRNLPEAVSERLLEVAGSVLVEDRPGTRVFAILALGAAESSLSAPALLQVLVSDSFSPGERAAAAQALARLGEHGQKALDEGTATLLSRGVPKEPTDTAWAPLRAALEGLDTPTRAKSELRKLAALPIAERAEGAAAAARRRAIWLRCRAADLLARDNSASPALAKCDPDAGPAFELAQIHVLSRSRIELWRKTAWEERLKSQHAPVVQAALRLIVSHPELGDVRSVLEKALGAESPGTRATAAKILAAYPSRAHDPKRPEDGPDPKIVAGLRAILEFSGDRLPEETMAAALGAAAALSTLALKPLIETQCRGPRPALRAAAQRALAILGSPGQRCPDPTAGKPEPAPAPVLEPGLTLEFESDLGPLRLILDQPSTARARAWVRARFEAGELSKGPVHGVGLGFSVQIGDADGDGFENDLPAPEAPLELGPWDVERGSVLMSSYAPDAVGSQLLVALEPLPALYGRRVLLGRAEGPWHALWPGDRLGQGRVVPR